MSAPGDDESRSSVPRWQDAAESRRATRVEPPHRRTRDFDTGSRAQLVKIGTWSILGGVLGGLLGVFGSVQGVWGTRTIVLFAAFGWSVSFVIPLAASVLGGRAARTLYTPSGRSTPRRQGYSYAQSLAARGLHRESIAAFEAAIAESPGDATPYVRIARIHRDGLGEPEDAAHWLKRAIREADLSEASGTLVRRELVELYVSRMKEPARAAPILARMAEELRGKPAGAWAADELARVRAMIAGDAGDR